MIDRSTVQILQVLPVEPSTGNVYFHQASVMLPPIPDNLGRLLYWYTPARGPFPADLRIVSYLDVASAEAAADNSMTDAAFQKALSKIPACALGVNADFGKLPGGGEPGSSKRLANGQTVYFAMVNDKVCPNKSLLMYVEKLSSY